MGDKTDNNIFYKPDYNASGTGEKAAFDAGLDMADKMILQSAAPGVLVNGKLSVSFSSGTLYVGIKTADGGTPSPTNPVFCRVGARVVTITAALEMTKTASASLGAGNSWLHLAQPAMSGYETDLFAYIGYDEIDEEPTLFVSRSGWHDRHAFNYETSGHGALTSQTSLRSYTGEEIAVCGRFNAILTTPNVWSSPATQIIIQKPITNTRMLAWNHMMFAPYGGTLDHTWTFSLYQMEGKFFNYYVFGFFAYSAAPNTLANFFEFTLPLSSQYPTAYIWQAMGRYKDYEAGPDHGVVVGICEYTNTLRICKHTYASYSLGTIFLSFHFRHYIPGTIIHFDL